MNELLAYVFRFGKLNQQQIALIAAKAQEIDLEKDAYFSEVGKVANKVGFILDGVVRVCYDNSKGEEITKYFIEEHNLVVDMESFDNEIPSTANVQAITRCKLLVFSKKDWRELLATINGWAAIVHKITTRALMQKVERLSP